MHGRLARRRHSLHVKAVPRDLRRARSTLLCPLSVIVDEDSETMRMSLIIFSMYFLGCGGGVVQRIDGPPPLPAAQRALQISVAPSDAEVFVNDRYMGTIDRYRDGWIAVPSKGCRIQVSQAGYYSWYAEVPDGHQPWRIKVELLRLVDSDPSL